MNIDNKIVTALQKNGSFRFPLKFDIFNKPQSIEGAVFDTGCGHSLISINSLRLDRPLDDIKNYLIYTRNSYLCTGRGVDTPKNTQEMFNLVTQINKYKQQSVSDKQVYDLINNALSKEQIQLILNTPSIRFSYNIKNLHINKVPIGDYTIRIGLHTNVNLIGMHIIRDLYTKIYPEGEKIRLYAIRMAPNTSIDEYEAEISELAEEMSKLEEIDFYENADEQVLESNYILSQINKN